VRADDQTCGTAFDCCKRCASFGLALAATEPCQLEPGITKPVVEVLPVLFGQQFGWCHDSCLHTRGHRPETGRRGNHRLARSDVTLDQAHHWMRRFKIGRYLRNDPFLCGSQLKRESADKLSDDFLAAAKCDRIFLSRQIAKVAEAHVVRQQFLETQAQLTGVFTGIDVREIGFGWWFVQKDQCLDQRRHSVFVANGFRQKFVRRRFAHHRQRLSHQVPQPSLLHAFSHWIDGRQAIADGNILLRSQHPVLRVHHLKANRSRPDVAECTDDCAGLELGLLLARKIKEAQRKLAAAVADANKETAPSSINGLRQQHLTAYEAPHARFQRAKFE
jgi:hypothetical protein